MRCIFAIKKIIVIAQMKLHTIATFNKMSSICIKSCEKHTLLATIRFILFACLVLIHFSTFGNSTSNTKDSSYPSINVLRKIASLQDEKTGSFESERKYFYSWDWKKDDNVFFTSLVIFTIKHYQNQLSDEEKNIVENIQCNSLPYFQQFRSPKNKYRYNFWRKTPPQVFPNGGWLNLFNKSMALPDDIDDCAMVAMVSENDKNRVADLKKLFSKYASGVLKRNKTFYRKYREDRVYSTWLSEKYPVDIDICVLSNVLLMNYFFDLPLNALDSSSMNLIIHAIKDNKHLTDAEYVSKHYSNSSTIIYHMARLMSFSNYEPLQELKGKLISDAKNLLSKTNHSLEKLLLYNSLLLMGDYSITQESITEDDLQENTYPFFVANMTATLTNPFNRIFNFFRIGRFNYYCNAFNQSLLFENIMLQERKPLHSPNTSTNKHSQQQEQHN
ncbi:MAG: hypothetical protein KGO81_14775 [Bacteroidota bacterium]|nr:hypothetical protein [Bacteroidota bacterium]